MFSTKKTWVAVFTIILVMLIFPVMVLKFAPGDAAMGLCIILFFLINPLTVIALSVMAGTELRKLWLIPVASAVAFPFLFSVAVWELVMDLFIYSALYFCIGTLVMLGTHYGIKYLKKKK